jgi:hypothetical protein
MNIREFTPGIELHRELNPLLWEHDHLKPEVRLALEHIAHKFELFLGFPIKVIDTIITGSQTAYTYTRASDIDLHLIVSFAEIQCDQPVHELFDTKRKLWKEEHSIDIHGIPVECYVEDLALPVNGHSYSITRDQWQQKPRPIEDHSLPDDVIKETLRWTELIKDSIASANLSILHKTKQMLKSYRSQGLGHTGELGLENLVFKTLRNNGVIADLMKSINHLEDQTLSLNS